MYILMDAANNKISVANYELEPDYLTVEKDMLNYSLRNKDKTNHFKFKLYKEYKLDTPYILQVIVGR